MNHRDRKDRAKTIRDMLNDPRSIMSPYHAEYFKRMIWDLEKPPFSELRRTLYTETIGGQR